MLLLACPNCGPRNVNEFRFGGEYNPRPLNPVETDDPQWSDYLFMRPNRAGLQTEWWYHRHGCGLWFLAERDTRTSEIKRTWAWSKGEREQGR